MEYWNGYEVGRLRKGDSLFLLHKDSQRQLEDSQRVKEFKFIKLRVSLCLLFVNLCETTFILPS